MLDLSWSFFAIAGPATIFAGFSKGGFGSGASFAAAAILALVIEPELALGVMLPLMMLIDFASLAPYWKKWLPRVPVLLVLGGLPGVVIGGFVISYADADTFRILIGLIALGFVLWQIAQSRGWFRAANRSMPSWAGVFAGTIAGFTSCVSHAGGPAAAVYLLSLKPTKTEYQATTVIVFWVINIAKFFTYAQLGMFTLETGQANLALAPFALFGTWLGVKAHHVMPERLFFTITYVALTVTGTCLVWQGMT